MKTHWNGPSVSFIDLYFCLFLFFFGMTALVSKPVPPATNGDIPICSMAIDIEWPDGADVDVDLWGKAGTNRSVGYAARDGVYLDLVRDDLGNIREGKGPNNERLCGRGFVNGEYIFNVHLYRVPRGEPLPIAVDISIKLIDPSTAYMIEIWKGSVTLQYVGEEITVIRFDMLDGRLVPNSFNTIPVKLRTLK